MKRTIQIGTQQIEILQLYECDPADASMEFWDESLTLDSLRRFMSDPLNMITLRNALSELIPILGIPRLTDEEVLQQFAWQIDEGYIRLVRRIEGPPRITGRGASSGGGSGSDSGAGQDTRSGGGSRADSGAGSGAGQDTRSGTGSGAGSGTAAGVSETSGESPTDTETAVPQEETDWIEFRIVDDGTDQPVPGIILKIKLPTGNIRDYTTDGDGIVRIEDLPSGTCDIVKITDPDAAEVVQIE